MLKALISVSVLLFSTSAFSTEWIERVCESEQGHALVIKNILGTKKLSGFSENGQELSVLLSRGAYTHGTQELDSRSLTGLFVSVSVEDFEDDTGEGLVRPAILEYKQKEWVDGEGYVGDVPLETVALNCTGHRPTREALVDIQHDFAAFSNLVEF